MIEASFAKLNDGTWGLRAKGTVTEGDRVRAVKRNGSAQVLTVGYVVWSGRGVTLARIARDESEARPARETRPEARDPEARAAESEAPRPAPRASAPADNGPPAWDAPPPGDDDYLTAA